MKNMPPGSRPKHGEDIRTYVTGNGRAEAPKGRCLERWRRSLLSVERRARRSNHRDQTIRTNRLGEEVIETCIDAKAAVIGVAPTRQADEACGTLHRACSQVARHIATAHVWHLEIDQGQMRMKRRRGGKPLRAVECNGRCASHSRQKGAQRFRTFHVVVDNKDPQP